MQSLIFSSEAILIINGSFAFFQQNLMYLVLKIKHEDMSKKLCKKDKVKKKDIKEAKYQCKKCGIKTNKEKKVCKPEKI